MIIPQKVKICGQIFTVVMVENLNDGIKMLSGYIDYGKSEISLNKGIGEQQQQVTLLHEILHGLFTVFGIKVDDEEEVVERLAYGMQQVLTDNDF